MSYAESSAQTLRDQLFTAWSLSNPLEKAPVTGGVAGRTYVYFFDRAQIVKNEKPKALVVEKIVHEGDENRVVHPKFIEQADIYEITLYLRVTSVNPDQFDVWLTNMDNMALETITILKSIYDPTTTTGVFFQTNGQWSNEDIYTSGAQPELRRKLRFTLTRIVSTDDEVFLGYGGVLVFDTSVSTGDNLPVSDYTFTQVKDAKLREGYPQIPTLTKDTTNGVGVPFLDRGIFSGTFTATMYAKKSDIIGDTTEKLRNIYKTQGDSPLVGQQADVVFLQSNVNTESTPVTLTKQSFMKIIQIEEIDDVEDLVSYRISGQLTRPTVFTESS